MDAAEERGGERKYRILLAKPGLDGHDRGVHVVAAALRDAGFEVIYLGLRQTPESIAEAALQEDVDGVGLSVLSGAHMLQFTRLQELLRREGLGDVLLFGGGIIPQSDREKLNEIGIGRLFGPGTPLTEIVDYLQSTLPKKTDRSGGFDP